MSVQIHGKEYVTVAERLQEARKDIVSITTEVLPNGGAIVIKATVTIKTGVFTGISAANPSKAIEKMSPYEVAETSAVGRALGFAGYGAVESIASADEVAKAIPDPTDEWPDQEPAETTLIPGAKATGKVCQIHHKDLVYRGKDKEENEIWDHRGKGIISPDGSFTYSNTGTWHKCTGKGWI